MSVEQKKRRDPSTTKARRVGALVRGGVLILALGAGGAVAQAGETAEDRKAAAKAFAEGQKAFSAGDFRHAAESFEQAYQRAPRLPPLWNAARAWHRASEPARAANLYARYLKEAPPSAPDRASALAAMKDLESKLTRLEIHADGFQDVTLDGVKIEGTTIYVSPGVHVVEGKKGKKVAQEKLRTEAGGSLSVVLIEPPSPPPPPPPPASSSVEPRPSRGLPPLAVGVGAGLTAVGVGLSIWSGLDTLKQKEAFDSRPTQRNLDEGHARQARTNVLLALSGGLAVATVVVAVAFTDWNSRASARLEVAPGGLWLRGAF